jgi:hypothetical protein
MATSDFSQLNMKLLKEMQKNYEGQVVVTPDQNDPIKVALFEHCSEMLTQINAEIASRPEGK